MQIGDKVVFHSPRRNTEREAVRIFGDKWEIGQSGKFKSNGVFTHGVMIFPRSARRPTQHLMARWVLEEQVALEK